MECNSDVQIAFSKMSGWEKTTDKRDAVEKLFIFSDFKKAFSFMTIVALKAVSVLNVWISCLFLLPNHRRTPANAMTTINNIIFALLLILIIYITFN